MSCCFADTDSNVPACGIPVKNNLRSILLNSCLEELTSYCYLFYQGKLL